MLHGLLDFVVLTEQGVLQAGVVAHLEVGQLGFGRLGDERLGVADRPLHLAVERFKMLQSL